MYFKISVLIFVFIFFTCPINTHQQLRQRRNPEPSIAASIHNFLMASANNLTSQNDTRNPTVIFDSLHHKIKSYRQDKSDVSNDKTLNETIDEFDLLTEKLQQNRPIKIMKRFRNATKKLRNIAFQHGEQLIRIAMKAYNRDMAYSTEHALNNVMISRESHLADTYVQKINMCLKTLQIQILIPVVNETDVENAKKICHNNFLAATSSVILNSYATMKTANQTVLSALTILRNCSEKFKNDQLIECIENQTFNLNQKILQSCANIYSKTIESANLIQAQAIYYRYCLRNIRTNIDQNLLISYNIQPGLNCTDIMEDLV